MMIKDKNLYYIGGIVRDELLGIESIDIDLTYEGNAIEFVKNHDCIEIIQINQPFGTVRAKIDGKIVDIASTRSEIYPQKGHLPVVDRIGCSLKEDVLRRDFTINALAKSTVNNEIIDYTQGLDDLKNKQIRVLHDQSFIDDPTRIVRALKFAVRLGFEIESHTNELISKYIENVNYDISNKRLKKELEETFNLNVYEAFKQFISKKIYKLITRKDVSLPEIDFSQLIKNLNIKKPWIIYAGLIPDIENLPLTKHEKEIVEDFKKLKTLEYNSDFEIYKNFSNSNIESVIMYTTVNESVVIKYINELCRIKLNINGKDLKSLGIKPSSKYQDCFDFVLKEKIKNPMLKKAEELSLAKIFFNQYEKFSEDS